MAGLNPSGLGVNRTFQDTTHDSVNTEVVGITDQDTGTIWDQKIINGRLYVEVSE